MWLWEVIHSLDLETCSRLFQFLFGATEPPPLDDTKATLLWIEDSDNKRVRVDPSQRVLMLPEFKNKRDLAYNLRLAIELDVTVALELCSSPLG